ncbi:MAG TPA: pilus assembly protein N-terminal domain-containing protein [Terriglobales bacterium]|nr:pilus assembly protein N-terminal domain-containing protein [Terriglobales bacterium]
MYRSSGLRVATALCFVLGMISAVMPATAEDNNPTEGQTVHVLVGKSVVMNVQAPMARVLSSNPAVVETLAISPNEVVIEGKAAGASTLILWDSAGRSQVLDVVVDIDIAGLRSAIQRSYPNEQLQVQADGGHLILTGNVSDPRILETLTKMAGTYSNQVVNSVNVDPGHDPQVMLEVKFAEVDRTKLTQFGVNILSTGAGNTIGTTTTGQFGNFGTQRITDAIGIPASPKPNIAVPTVGPNQEVFKTEQTLSQLLNIFLFKPDIHLGATIQALQQQNVLQILAEPNLMAMNGQKASFLAGGEFPFPVIQGGANVGAVTIQFRPFGVRLDFVGNVGPDNVIRLQVAPEVSTLDFSNALTISGFTVPAISTRRAETEIELKDGQSFGIAGLLDRRATVQLSRVPGIGDIPVLGELFRSRSINRSNAELLVLVTPHIIDPLRATSAPPAAPKPATPFLDNKEFDKRVPGSKDVGTTTPSPSAK